MVYEWDIKDTKKLTLRVGDFNGPVGKIMDRFEGVYEGNGIGEQNLEDRTLLEFSDQNDLCLVNTWF